MTERVGVADRARMSAQEHVLAAASWSRDSPVPEPATADRLILVLESLRALSAVRRQVRAFLTASLPVAAGVVGEDAVEKAVLVIDELTSNAVRHGAQPSRLQVCDDVDCWVVVVSDSAPDRLPTPAVERPAGAGGYGLHVVADLADAHGVHHDTAQKHVWACLQKPLWSPSRT